MKLLQIREERGGVVADFEADGEFFAFLFYESNGDFCLQVINSEGLRSAPVTVREWFKIRKKLSEIHRQCKLVGLKFSKEKIREALDEFVFRIENSSDLKSVLLRESEQDTPVDEKPEIRISDDERKDGGETAKITNSAD